jgi:hypothetical protein
MRVQVTHLLLVLLAFPEVVSLCTYGLRRSRHIPSTMRTPLGECRGSEFIAKCYHHTWAQETGEAETDGFWLPKFIGMGQHII